MKAREMNPGQFTQALLERTGEFARKTGEVRLSFDGYVYNPLEYAWETHSQYLRRYVRRGASVLFLGMNPGPFGMAQTGVPFGEVCAVRDWMGISGPVGRPSPEHPARPVLGFDIGRHEVSGQRFWGLLRQRYGTADACFDQVCVMNYCPLLFLDGGERARNVPADKLPRSDREALDALCDDYLADVITLIEPDALIGVGKYAQGKLERAAARLAGWRALTVGVIPHPSPANPGANSDWPGAAQAAMCRFMGAV
jgi:single-strand selective monofunctional uracil DNA glycosylase